MKKRYTEEQIIGFLREADAGLPVKELCRKHGFSEPSYYAWKAKFGGMNVSDAQRLKALEAENTKLKKLPDLATGQPMSLELYGRLQFVDGLHLDSEAGRAWSERRIDAYCEAQSRTPGELPPVEGSEFFMALEAATYSNVQFPGVGVPFYM